MKRGGEQITAVVCGATVGCVAAVVGLRFVWGSHEMIKIAHGVCGVHMGGSFLGRVGRTLVNHHGFE